MPQFQLSRIKTSLIAACARLQNVAVPAELAGMEAVVTLAFEHVAALLGSGQLDLPAEGGSGAGDQHSMRITVGTQTAAQIETLEGAMRDHFGGVQPALRLVLVVGSLLSQVRRAAATNARTETVPAAADTVPPAGGGAQVSGGSGGSARSSVEGVAAALPRRDEPLGARVQRFAGEADQLSGDCPCDQ